MTTTVTARVGIFDSRAEQMNLTLGTATDCLFLGLTEHTENNVWIALANYGADLEAEAEAMDRLAELAGQAAAQLRELIAATVKAGERR